MKLPPGFTEKEFKEASDEYLKGLFGIKDTQKKARKMQTTKKRGMPNCACNDATDKKD